MSEQKMRELQKKIQYSFKNIDLLYEALSHSSYVNEKRIAKYKSNERLEFLGDAVLELISSEQIYISHRELQEGDLSKIRAGMVCEKALAACARIINLGEYLMLGKGEALCGGADRDSILSDGMEAVIGAVYLDGGFEAARAFVKSNIINETGDNSYISDSKTLLQEIIQAEMRGQAVYELMSAVGPDHDKEFTISVKIDDVLYGTGTGKSKKEAEQKAAYEAIDALRNK